MCAVAEALCSIAAQWQAQHHQQEEAPGGQQQQAGDSSSCSDSQAQFEHQEQEVLQQISSGYITELRQKMLRVIEELAEQKQ
jgi:hypothetical protein